MASTAAGARPDEMVDLAGLAFDLVEEYRHLPRTAGLRITSEGEGRVEVAGSALQLERLLRNLLDNTCRHAHGAVLVRVTAGSGSGSSSVIWTTLSCVAVSSFDQVSPFRGRSHRRFAVQCSVLSSAKTQNWPMLSR
ncbi:hypothetical protein GCM10009664_59400 [Kitasatospora gansuensis]